MSQLCHICQTRDARVDAEGFVEACLPCSVERQRANKMKARLRQLPELIVSSNIPPLYNKARLEDFPKPPDLSNSAFVFGGAGTGKTHLLCADLIERLMSSEDPKSHLFVVGVDLLGEIKNTFDSKTTTEQQIVDKYCSIPNLYLDDLGAEKATEWVVPVLYRIINHRYNWMLRTVISSNLTIDQLAEKFNDRIASRIAGMCTQVELKGRDRRLTR